MAAKKDYYNTGDDSDGFYIPDSLPDRKICQTFTTTSAYNATSVKLKLKRIGTLGNISVSITTTSGGDPTGSNLAVCVYDGDLLSISSAWVEFTFSTSTPLADATKYAIVLYAPNITTSNGADSSRIIWRQDIADGTYSGGQTGYQNERVDSWTVPARASYPDDDTMFEVWAVTSGELTVITGACANTIAESSTGYGTITDGGASAVTQHGHCWATTTDPTTSLTTKTTLGASPNLGQFKSFITGLTPSTTYYVRAYATNTQGTAYGANVTTATTTTIGSREIWEEDTAFHYIDQYATERKVEGTTVTGAHPYPGSISLWRG